MWSFGYSLFISVFSTFCCGRMSELLIAMNHSLGLHFNWPSKNNKLQHYHIWCSVSVGAVNHSEKSDIRTLTKNDGTSKCDDGLCTLKAFTFLILNSNPIDGGRFNINYIVLLNCSLGSRTMNCSIATVGSKKSIENESVSVYSLVHWTDTKLTRVLPGARGLVLDGEVDKMIPLPQHHHCLYVLVIELMRTASILHIQLHNWYKDGMTVFTLSD